MKKLWNTHDKELLVKACEDLLDITADFVRLKAETRKLSWQLLGPPSEQMDAFNNNPVGSPRQGKQAPAKPADPPTEALPPRAKVEKKPRATTPPILVVWGFLLQAASDLL